MVITIDGLGVNGKSTLAQRISQSIGFKNFNTGAIYRCIAITILENKIDITNIEEVMKKIEKIKIDFIDKKVYLYDLDVTQKIRTDEISFYSTKWATIPQIKEFVRNYQKEFIKNNNTIMEGRDIATRIAPDAEIKFYLYSDFETRINRLCKMNPRKDINEIRKDLELRDEIDINGGNFIKPAKAIEIDTTKYSLDEVYNIMMNEINKVLKIGFDKKR